MFLTLLLFSSFGLATTAEEFRLGIIGTDTSHVPAFVKLFNDPNAEGLYQKYEIVAAYKGGMPDNPSSWDRKDKYAEDIQNFGVKIFDSIESMLPHVDGILLESVDGRPHLEFARPALEAKKPIFIDKPMGGNLQEVLEIFRLARENETPVFSASSLRYSEGMQKIRTQSPLGKTHGVDAWSPCALNEKHPDFYWYGVHGVETLFTMMGPGCVSVSRTHSEKYDVAVGLWEDGRIGLFRGIRAGSAPYGGVVFGDKKVEFAGKYDGYKPLADVICLFFESGVAPIEERETTEIFAFMSAADVSKTRNGASVTLEEVLEAARQKEFKTFTLSLDESGTWTLDGNATTLDEARKTMTLPTDAATLYYRVILKKAPNAPHEEAMKALDYFGDAVFVRYDY
ncbi:MAG: Gfo/Idh/MocA family oxidoreductase [Planctomycetia bacterium]|nr:Gfo/Idh/MocA family oxidoreductase [Planctomycetia bacterium]